MHPSEREPQEVELPFRNLADACLFRVDRQLQLAHEFAHPVQCFFSLAPSAQDHEIVGIGHDPTAEALSQSELLPSQHKPAHVEIRQQRREWWKTLLATATIYWQSRAPHLHRRGRTASDPAWATAPQFCGLKRNTAMSGSRGKCRCRRVA